MSTWASVAALKNVDLPTLGFPTRPMRTCITERCSLLFGSRDAVISLDLSDGDIKFREIQFSVAIKVHALHKFSRFNAGQRRDVGSLKGGEEFSAVYFP